MNGVYWASHNRYGPLEMPALKNMRHEKFVREYLKCDFNGAEAYRRVYPQRRPLEARFSASRLLTSGNVKRRLAEVQMALLKKADITVDRILNEYEEARLLAVEQGKPEAMLSASEKKAKLVGLLVDRREVGNAGEFEQLTDIGEILEKVRQEAGLEAAEALAKAFGLDANPNEAQPNGDDLDTLEPPTGSMN
jgi:Terminase small subunit